MKKVLIEKRESSKNGGALLARFKLSIPENCNEAIKEWTPEVCYSLMMKSAVIASRPIAKSRKLLNGEILDWVPGIGGKEYQDVEIVRTNIYDKMELDAKTKLANAKTEDERKIINTMLEFIKLERTT